MLHKQCSSVMVFANAIGVQPARPVSTLTINASHIPASAVLVASGISRSIVLVATTFLGVPTEQVTVPILATQVGASIERRYVVNLHGVFPRHLPPPPIPIGVIARSALRACHGRAIRREGSKLFCPGPPGREGQKSESEYRIHEYHYIIYSSIIILVINDTK